MLSLIKNLTNRGSDRKANSRQVTRRGYRPALEGLEGRISLSSLPTPISTSGGNPTPPAQH
jgi:hypothetical protein